MIAARAVATLVALVSTLATCGDSSTDPVVVVGEVQLDLREVVSGLASPVFLTAPTGDTRQFVVEQPGRIRVIRNGQLLPTPFLDITAKVRFGGEQGLLSMAFDPAYATNGRFFVYYTVTGGNIVIEQYAADQGSDVARTTGTIVLSIPHPTFTNHNGGLLAFGPDGLLYLATGDGGGGGDPQGNGQNLASLLGKMLRIDVRTLPYTVPASNPFVGQAGRRSEIWAYGLRNPWRFAFDRGAPGGATLYIADVGQNLYEEISRATATEAGVNYGWSRMEGAHCYPSGESCDRSGLRLPIVEYGRSTGCSIAGGFVYRGSAIPEIRGQYFYSDYCTGFLASVSAEGTAVPRLWTVPNVGAVLSFGEDAAGELYVLTGGGGVYRLVKL